MAHAAKNETEAFGLLGPSMKRLTAPGSGSSDERHARCDGGGRKWEGCGHAPRIQGAFGLLVYRKEAKEFPSICQAAPSLYFETKPSRKLRASSISSPGCSWRQ